MQDKTPRKPEQAAEKPAVPTTDELGDEALDAVNGGNGNSVPPRGPTGPGG
jgi:hypothetical protein